MIKESLHKVDWNKFFSVVGDIGPSLNSRKLRFDKSDLIEKCLEICSTDKQIKWVDEIGWDHIIGPSKIKVEMKSQVACLYTNSGNVRKSGKTTLIKLMNSLGSATARSPNEVLRFDDLLLIDTGNTNTFSAAILSKGKMTQYADEWLTFKDDGVTGQFPIKELEFIVRPTDISETHLEQITPSYRELKNKAQFEYLEQFKG